MFAGYKTLTQCCFNVGLTSKTVGQHYNNIGSMCCACWAVSDGSTNEAQPERTRIKARPISPVLISALRTQVTHAQKTQSLLSSFLVTSGDNSSPPPTRTQSGATSLPLPMQTSSRACLNTVWFLDAKGFSHRLTPYKIVGHFFGRSYLNISLTNQVKNSFFRISNISAPCPHAQLRSRTVNKKLWTFFGPWGRDRSQSPPC